VTVRFRQSSLVVVGQSHVFVAVIQLNAALVVLQYIALEDSRFPTVLLSNVCNLTNKSDDLSVVSEQYYPNIICVTETWLNSNIPDTAVKLGGYNIIRKDRSSGMDGGVAVYTSCSINYCKLSFENFEI